MKVEFRNTTLDFMLFNITHQFKNGMLQFVYILLPVFILFSEYAHVTQGVRDTSFIDALRIAATWYIAIWVVQFVITLMLFSAKQNKSFLTTHTISLQDDALLEETKFNRSYFFWDGVEKIVRMPTLIAIYTAQHQAVLVPQRAFENSDKMDAFYNDVVARIPKPEPDDDGWGRKE